MADVSLDSTLWPGRLGPLSSSGCSTVKPDTNTQSLARRRTGRAKTLDLNQPNQMQWVTEPIGGLVVSRNN